MKKIIILILLIFTLVFIVGCKSQKENLTIESCLENGEDYNDKLFQQCYDFLENEELFDEFVALKGDSYFNGKGGLCMEEDISGKVIRHHKDLLPGYQKLMCSQWAIRNAERALEEMGFLI